MLGEERGGRVPRAHDRMRDEPAEKREIRRDAVDLRLGECAAKVSSAPPGSARARSASRSSGRRRGRPRRPPRRRRRLATSESPCNNCHLAAQPIDPARLGQESPGILRVEPHLDRVAVELVTVCYKGISRRDPELLRDEIEAGDGLRDGVLDLDAAVQLEEEEVVAVEDELDRAGAAVADGPAERDGRLVQGRAQRAGRGPAQAPPRAPSGAAAARSSRARRPRRPSRARRRGAAPRRGAAARGSARSRACRRRTRPRPRAPPRRAPRRARPRSARRACLDHRRPPPP